MCAVMDRLRRWRPRRPAGLAGARRAGLTALILFAVTVAVAILLAVLFHLAWPPVLVAIAGTVPALYLAWAALPGALRPSELVAPGKPTYGRLARQWKPQELGVHQVIGGGPMPAYVGRAHDELLRAVLDPSVAASRLVVVRGGSSTGKTRAAYEAVAARLADWQLDYPLDPAALKARLEAGIPARTVLWLGELRQYADADGGADVLGRLADLLHGEGHLLITTVWPEQWNTYAAAARARADPADAATARAGPGPADAAGTAGRLLQPLPELKAGDSVLVDLARGGVIDVPGQFTTGDLDAASRTGDPVLAAAVAAAADAGQGGQVTQYLAGVPDLLDRYNGPGGDPYGQAIITVAMDATRLGHVSLLPAALLQDAAVGYLTGPQRIKPITAWREPALAWATAELRGAVRALQPVPPPSSTGIAGYQVADYLDQYARRTREDQLSPASLWDAVTVHTISAADLTRLAQAAGDRGLYRHAAALSTTAATLGDTFAAAELLTYLREASPGDTVRAAHWAATHARLDNPPAVVRLLGALRAAGDSDAVTILASRAASHAPLDNPLDAAWLLRALRETGDSGAVAALASRAAAHARLDNPSAVAWLLRALRETGDSGAVAALASRAAAHARLDNPSAVAELLGALRAAGDSGAVAALASRAAAHARLDNPSAVAELLGALRAAGDSDAVAALLARDPAAHARLDNPSAVTKLLGALRAAGDSDAVAALLARDPAAHARLDNPSAVTKLLGALRAAGDSDAVAALLARDPAAYARLDNPLDVAELLRALRAAGDRDAIMALASRAAAHANLLAVTGLLRVLRETGDSDAIMALASRAAAHANLDDPLVVIGLLGVLRAAGDSDAIMALASRAAAHANLDNPSAVADLLTVLRATGDSDAVTALASRAAAHANLDNPSAVAWLLRVLRATGDSDAIMALASRAAAHANLDNPSAVADLLTVLRATGDSDAVTALASRAAAHANLNDPRGVADLLREMRAAGDSDAVTALASRAAAHANLDNPRAVTELLRTLHEAADSDAVTALLARDPAAHARLDNPSAVTKLLGELHAAGDSDAATTLASRAANAGMFDLFLEACPDEASSYRFGREPDGSPSLPWRWREPASRSR